MSNYLTEENSEAVVIDRLKACDDARFRTIMIAAIRHLHAFVKEVEPSQEEWEAAIAFLTRTGQISDDTRQEFILLSDVLGVSMLVDAINHRRPSGATETTVLGPFHVDGAPELPMDADLCQDGKGESCLYKGRVLDLEGTPISGAVLDVWSDNAEGYYDVQQPDLQPAMNMRGRLTTGADGRYSFKTIRPVSYPIPTDGPVGQMLAGMGRHPNRPGHIHFIVSAPGFKTTVTHLFDSRDPGLHDDCVFGVKQSLIVDFRPEPSDEAQWRADYDFVLDAA
ncbi:MAG: intradiol ring-cleavage dioxygenase [Rhodospirillales bacterium]